MFVRCSLSSFEKPSRFGVSLLVHIAVANIAADNIRSRIAAFNNIPRSTEYVLAARGVSSEKTVFRNSGGGIVMLPTDDEKQIIRDAINEFIRPYLAT